MDKKLDNEDFLANPKESDSNELQLEESEDSNKKPFLSQAAVDMANLSEPISKKETKVSQHKARWFILWLTSIASLLFWAFISFTHEEAYQWEALILTAIAVVSTVVTYKFLSLANRGAIAFLFLSLALNLTLFKSTDTSFFTSYDLSLIPSILLVSIAIWVLIPLWFKLKKFNILKVIISIIILYSISGILWTFANYFYVGDISIISIDKIGVSPLFITENLNVIFWPITVAVFILLPLAFIVALGYQFQNLKGEARKHFANLVMALTFIIVAASFFMIFNHLKTNFPLIEKSLVNIYPEALIVDSNKPQENTTQIATDSNFTENNNVPHQTIVEENLEPVADSVEENEAKPNNSSLAEENQQAASEESHQLDGNISKDSHDEASNDNLATAQADGGADLTEANNITHDESPQEMSGVKLPVQQESATSLDVSHPEQEQISSPMESLSVTKQNEDKDLNISLEKTLANAEDTPTNLKTEAGQNKLNSEVESQNFDIKIIMERLNEQEKIIQNLVNEVKTQQKIDMLIQKIDNQNIQLNKLENEIKNLKNEITSLERQ